MFPRTLRKSLETIFSLLFQYVFPGPRKQLFQHFLVMLGSFFEYFSFSDNSIIRFSIARDTTWWCFWDDWILSWCRGFPDLAFCMACMIRFKVTARKFTTRWLHQILTWSPKRPKISWNFFHIMSACRPVALRESYYGWPEWNRQRVHSPLARCLRPQGYHFGCQAILVFRLIGSVARLRYLGT